MTLVRPSSPEESRHIDADPAGTRKRARTNVFFVNYDGVTLTQGEQDDATANTTMFPEFVMTYAPYGDGSKRAASLQAVRSDWSLYDVTITDVRPLLGLYTMCVATPTNPYGGGVLGAAQSDCSDETPSNVVLAFHGVDDEFSAVAQAATISHELAHAYGLEHVDQPADIMNPAIVGKDPAFLDECLPLNGGGGPIQCEDEHKRYCGADRQRSHQELLWLFGPKAPDYVPPEVVITQPGGGDVFTAPARITIVAEASDDVGIAAVDLHVDGVSRGAADMGAPYRWVDETFPEGRHCLRVDARDHGLNLASSPEVCFSVLPGDDDGESASSGDESTDGETAAAEPGGSEHEEAGCSCVASAGSQAPGTFAALALASLARRRRVAAKARLRSEPPRWRLSPGRAPTCRGGHRTRCRAPWRWRCTRRPRA